MLQCVHNVHFEQKVDVRVKKNLAGPLHLLTQSTCLWIKTDHTTSYNL